MTRIKRGYIARKRRTKIRLFTSSFRRAHAFKTLVLAHRDRGRKKGDFRSLWISRINAIIGQNKQEIHNIYSDDKSAYLEIHF